MNSPNRSAYAAPNTPIASSKRPRSTTKSGTVQAVALTKYHNQAKNDTKINGKKEVIVLPTPSKQLFSPGLRTELTQHSAHHIHNNEDGSDSQHLVDKEEKENVNYESPSSNLHITDPDNTPIEIDNDEEEEDSDEFNPYQFISMLPSYNTVCIIDKICLPPLNSSSYTPNNRQILPTLALDLDETLVHCTVEPIEKPDLIFPVAFNNQVYQVYVRKRPYLDYFLETVCKSFEVVVFTASQKVYADVLLDKLDPERKLIKHRLFREACLLVQGNYLKDLHVLGRDLKQSLLVDNSPHAYSYHIDNGVPIESWYDDDTDTELLKLIGFLKNLHGVDDCRPVIREHFKTYHLIERARNGLSVKLTAPPF